MSTRNDASPVRANAVSKTVLRYDFNRIGSTFDSDAVESDRTADDNIKEELVIGQHALHKNQAFLDITKVLTNQSEALLEMNKRLGQRDRENNNLRNTLQQICADCNNLKLDFDGLEAKFILECDAHAVDSEKLKRSEEANLQLLSKMRTWSLEWALLSVQRDLLG